MLATTTLNRKTELEILYNDNALCVLLEYVTDTNGTSTPQDVGVEVVVDGRVARCTVPSREFVALCKAVIDSEWNRTHGAAPQGG